MPRPSTPGAAPLAGTGRRRLGSVDGRLLRLGDAGRPGRRPAARPAPRGWGGRSTIPNAAGVRASGSRPDRDRGATSGRRAPPTGAPSSSIEDLRDRAPSAPERGLPWWAALLLLIALAGIGGVIDTIGSNQLKGGFNIGIVIASVVAILAVKRRTCSRSSSRRRSSTRLAAVFQLYVRSSGLHDKKVVLDAAANWLVYGFPAIAAATAAVLIIAGIRLIIRK